MLRLCFSFLLVTTSIVFVSQYNVSKANQLESKMTEIVPIISLQRIDKGNFEMGSSSIEFSRVNDENQHHVIISKSFDIMKYEITQLQWFKIMGSNPSKFKNIYDCNNHIYIRGESICPSNPVEQVYWTDVQYFIEKLNNKLKIKGCLGTPLDPKGCYRLPTEAEWEYAARSKTTTAYFFGDYPLNLKKYAWYYNNSNQKTHSVGLKSPNDYGLYDMYGNVSELVQDTYQSTLQNATDPLINSIWNSRVVRGGNWNERSSGSFRSARRDSDDEDGYFNDDIYISEASSETGFRLVKTL